jgi:hypothetical protein
MIISNLLERRRLRESNRSAAIWAKYPANEDDRLPDDVAQEMRVDGYVENLRQRWSALKALWGPAIRQRPRDSRKGWTIYDGHERNRDDEWTLWRGVLCTIAILLDRHWSEAAEARWTKRTGKAGSYGDRLNLAYFGCGPTYGGYDAWIVELAPGCRFSVFSDGECLM